jgi:hypothetical protein
VPAVVSKVNLYRPFTSHGSHYESLLHTTIVILMSNQNYLSHICFWNSEGFQNNSNLRTELNSSVRKTRYKTSEKPMTTFYG